MPSEQLFTARDVLRAREAIRLVGIDPLLPEWERREPDLAEHLLEWISELHRRLTKLGVIARNERRLRRESETLILLTTQLGPLLRHWQEQRGSAGRRRDVIAADNNAADRGT